jgi:hypothetical protein
MEFVAPPNISGVPSERLMAVIRASESPANSIEFWQHYSSTKNKSIQRGKIKHLTSETTKIVIQRARREYSAFVRPEDFPTVSDFEFLLWKQVSPCRPSAKVLKRKGIDLGESHSLTGVCCKHCARANRGEMHHKGMWFPASRQLMTESSFSQSLTNHMLSCWNIPIEIRDAFDELKRLASEKNIITKRNSKKKFLEKVWARMQKYYELEPNVSDEETSSQNVSR